MRQILFFGLTALIACGEEEKEETDTLPELISLEIQAPAPTLTNSMLSCIARASDADGDLITLTYQWFNQSDELLGEDRDLQLDPSTAQPEDIIRCEVSVIANEQSLTGSTEIVIENSAPVIEQFSVSPETVYVDSVLEVSASVTDLDGEEPSIAYIWQHNGTELSEAGASLALNAEDFSDGDVIAVTVEASDNYGGVSAETSEITIGNTAPVIGAAELTPSPLYSYQEPTCTPTDVFDLEGDEVSFTYLWSINGEEQAETSNLLTPPFAVNDEITCVVTPNDSKVDGDSVSATIIVENTTPTIDEISITPEDVYADSQLSCSAVASDLDLEEPVIDYQWADAAGNVLANDSILSLSSFSSSIGVNDELTCTATATDTHGASASSSISEIVLNTEPVAQTGAQISGTPTTNSELSCSAEFTDLDDGILVSSYVWSKADGTILGSSPSYTIDSAEINPEEELFCIASAADANGASIDSSTSIVIENTEPMIQTAAEISGTAQTGLELSCMAEFVDLDDGILTPIYEWSKADGTVLSSASTYLINSAETDPEEELFCVVSAVDANGASIESSISIVIENIEPAVASLELSTGSIYTNDTIVATVTLEDGDQDQTLTAGYVWHVIDASDGGAERTIDTGTDNTLSGGGPEHHFGKNDQVYVVVTPADGIANGVSSTSGSITISNSVPTAPDIAIIGSINNVPLAEEDDLHCQILTPSLDDDPEDIVSYEYHWMDPEGTTVSQISSTDTEDILSATQPTSYGTWGCEVTASDGDDSATIVQTEIFVDYDCHCPTVDAQDYAFTYWPENFRNANFGANGYQTERHFLTGFYGLEIDLITASLTKSGQWVGSGDIGADILTENTLIDSFLSSSLEYSVSMGPNSYLATDFLNSTVTGSHADLNPSELNDMGRFMQQIEIPEVFYESETDFEGRVSIAAAPRHVVFTQIISANVDLNQPFALEMRLDGDLWANAQVDSWLDGTRAVQIIDQNQDAWVLVLPDPTDVITQDQDGAFVFERTISSLSSGGETSLSLMIIPANDLSSEQLDMYLNPASVQIQYASMDQSGQTTNNLSPADWDETLGFYVVPMGDIRASGANTNGGNWDTYPEHHNVYNRHKLIIDHSSSEDLAIPILMDGPVNTTFNITSGAGMFRDLNGQPMGIPVQVSKNWHVPGYWPNWHHFYSAPSVPAGSHEIEFAVTGSKWGEIYAVSHAQLSLVGWGTNQQWDESAMGAWGESITYDPDLTLNRSMVDDVRPFLVDTSGQWNWTGNVGGADFLRYQDDGNTLQRLGRMRTHYESPGPNLTNVVYAGISPDGKVEATIRTHLLRGNDLVRAYYIIDYTLLDDVTYNRFSLFQVAADNYSDNGFTEAAYGDASGVISNIPIPNHGSTGYASVSDRGIAISGDAPWAMLFNSTKADGNLPELYADVGFVVRDYELDMNGVVETIPHININRTNNGGWSQYAFELGVPYDQNDPTLPAGTTIHAVVEYLVIPNDISFYYGDSDYLLALDPNDFGSTNIMEYLAAENIVSVTPTVGTVTQETPVRIATEDNSLAAQFTLDGGLGYVPLQFTGLHRHDGWSLERNEQGSWVAIDQSVHGDDFWQAEFDALTETYTLVYSVQNDDSHEYRLVRP